MSVEEKRLILREKVEAGKQRIAERDFAADAKNAAEEATNLVGKHPFAFIGGALALGMLIGSRGKKKPSKPAKKANFVAMLLAEAAISQGLKMIEKARPDEKIES